MIATIVFAALIFGYFFYVVRRKIKDARKGKFCSCGCQSCKAGCKEIKDALE